MSTATVDMVERLKRLPSEDKLHIIDELWESVPAEDVPSKAQVAGYSGIRIQGDREIDFCRDSSVTSSWVAVVWAAAMWSASMAPTPDSAHSLCASSTSSSVIATHSVTLLKNSA